MMRVAKALAVTVLTGAMVASLAPVNAAPLMTSRSGIGKAPAAVEQVQYRRWHGGGYHHHYHGGGGGALIGGLAAGAIIGGAIAASQANAAAQAQAQQQAAYCAQRFRSYDPGSGTYLGNDGYRHPCP